MVCTLGAWDRDTGDSLHDSLVTAYLGQGHGSPRGPIPLLPRLRLEAGHGGPLGNPRHHVAAADRVARGHRGVPHGARSVVPEVVCRNPITKYGLGTH